VEIAASPGDAGADARDLELKSISGGVLLQQADRGRAFRGRSENGDAPRATRVELAALEFGWKIAKHVKIERHRFVRAGNTLGIGAGQMSRVDSVKLAIMKAQSSLKAASSRPDASSVCRRRGRGRARRRHGP